MAIDYTYDPVGNRLSASDQLSVRRRQHFDRLSDRRLTGVDGISYTWDYNGNASINSAHRLLDDGMNTYTYLYGPSTGSGQASRLAQLNTVSPNTEYFLGDALGSVRQMVGANRNILLAKGYDLYSAKR